MVSTNKKPYFRKIECFLVEAKNEEEIYNIFNGNGVRVFKIKLIVDSFRDNTSLFKVVVSHVFDLGAAKVIFHKENSD